MIKVKIQKRDDKFFKITIKGHAEYDEKGKDIVCASVSSIVITSINAIVRVDEASIEYKELHGFRDIHSKKSHNIVNILIENMIDLLKELGEDYKNYIEIREV